MSIESKPDPHYLSFAVYFPHEGNLLALFVIVALIDADSVGPEGHGGCFDPERAQGVIEVLGDEE